ncbi:FadR/GntR family transcriptional regulator [Pyxidicoccus xibeiensis]|uniref:FadR/GntR family transcriptional regulator n=1 Tax=Pyxidicoccus xibeiensis TaxID=2906759 RepID=UPI0020A7989C|nr:GntR family transcriptional regulator [Pyxidicoccus xibeiensis]MCP3143631.1 GntR family transcriptional regulator [Pyxidicoccus xibeiensis]
MGRVGLVGYVEEQLERAIALGRLPRSGQLASEEKLARSYGVSRSTVREALRRLAARGLVVQHSGRKTRAVALDESVTLENMGLAFHDERSADGRRLLEGYFCLKRQLVVELLADCCATASATALGQLGDACFALWTAARWESDERCAQLEFDLLRLAARAADRPGHLLLVQSMQRGLSSLVARGVPLMDSESLRQWACCAMGALRERDAEALTHELPVLMRACDERVLGRLAPASEGSAVPEAAPCHREGALPVEPDGETPCRFDLGRPSESGSDVEPDGGTPCQSNLGRPSESGSDVEPDDGTPCQSNLGRPSESGSECAAERLPGAPLPTLSDCRTGSCASPPEGGLSPETPRVDSLGPTRFAPQASPFTTTPVSRAPLELPLPTLQDSLPREWPEPVASSSRMKVGIPFPEG